MKLEQLLDAFQRGGEKFDQIRTAIESRVRIESDGSKKRLTLQLEPAKEVTHIHFQDGDEAAALRLISGEQSTVEAWEEGGKRGITLRSPSRISWEMDGEQIEQIANAKAAGIACTVGAAFGFLAWLMLVATGKLMESDDETPKAIEDD